MARVAPPQSRLRRASSPLKGEQLKARAKALRKAATEEERWLWTELRALKSQGLKFRRQIVIGQFVVDFACHASRLVIELDGNQHGEPEHAKQDARRDAWLLGEGYHVMRFWNAELHQDVDSVVDAICMKALSRLSASSTNSFPLRGKVAAPKAGSEGVTRNIKTAAGGLL